MHSHIVPAESCWAFAGCRAWGNIPRLVFGGKYDATAQKKREKVQSEFYFNVTIEHNLSEGLTARED